MRRVDRRLLLLGDWHWLVRDPLDVLRLVFFAGTVAFAIMGRSTAVGLTAASLLLLIARIVNLPRRFDLGVIVAMTFIAWGTALSLYGRFHFYDTIVHGTTPVFYAPVLYVCLVRLGVLTDPEQARSRMQRSGVFVSTLAIGMAVGAGYEVIEWLSDSLLGTAFVENADDTGRDLLADTLGSLVGAAFVTAWSVSGWTSRRVTYRAIPPPNARAWARRARAGARRGGTLGRRRRSGATWPALVAAGGGSLVFGILLLAWPEPTAKALVRLFGIYAVAHGGLKLLVALIQRRHAAGVSLGVDAVATFGVGIAVLAWPRVSVALLFYAIALTILLTGLAGVAIASVLDLDLRERSLLGAASLSSVVIGVIVLAWPRDTVLTMRWLVAAQALVVGILLLLAAFRVRGGPPRAFQRPTKRRSKRCFDRCRPRRTRRDAGAPRRLTGDRSRRPRRRVAPSPDGGVACRSCSSPPGTGRDGDRVYRVQYADRLVDRAHGRRNGRSRRLSDRRRRYREQGGYPRWDPR